MTGFIGLGRRGKCSSTGRGSFKGSRSKLLGRFDQNFFQTRFIMKDTVEEKIMALQEKKLKLADGVLTGAKRTPGGNKLTMQELTSLFS